MMSCHACGIGLINISGNLIRMVNRIELILRYSHHYWCMPHPLSSSSSSLLAPPDPSREYHIPQTDVAERSGDPEYDPRYEELCRQADPLVRG